MTLRPVSGGSLAFSERTDVRVKDDCGWKFLTCFLRQKILVLLAAAWYANGMRRTSITTFFCFHPLMTEMGNYPH